MGVGKRLISLDCELPKSDIRTNYNAARFFYLSAPVIKFRRVRRGYHKAGQNAGNGGISKFHLPPPRHALYRPGVLADCLFSGT
jgi:hypothetical protein